MGELRVLIADDSEFTRVAYKRIIEDQSSMQIVARRQTGRKRSGARPKQSRMWPSWT